MAYISLYRKWRPQTFEEVIGQEYVTRTLGNSLRNGNFAHAYLFSGPRGTGKTSTARILAKALNCEEGPTPSPCNHCVSCRDITEGTSVDVIEIDAASTGGIDDIRDLRERVIFSPAAARIKVYILDEAHMLTKGANNALLKMVEEPPAHVVFVLATTEPHKMLPTILSRCQRFDFRSVPAPQLVKHLAHVAEEEKVKAAEGALRLIARRAGGSARDALVILEQIISYGDGVVEEAAAADFLGLIEDELLVELGDFLVAGDAAGAINLVEKAFEEGRDLTQFAREAQEHFRRVFLLQHASLSHEDLEVDENAYRSMRRQAEALSPLRTQQFIVALREAVKEMQATSSPRLVLEGALIGMARSDLDVSPHALAVRLERLEGEVEKWTRQVSGKAVPGDAAEVGERQGGDGLPEKGEAEGPARETDAKQAIEVESRVVEEVEPRIAAAPIEAAQAAAPLDLAAIRRAWPRIKESVKEKKITTHAFLLEGKPHEVQGDELVISFPPGRSFHQGEMEKEDHKKVLEEALAEVLGVELKVRSRVEEETWPHHAADERGVEKPRKTSRASTEHIGLEAGDDITTTREEMVEEANEDLAITGEKMTGEAKNKTKPKNKGKAETETYDAGKVKLVKDVFGAEMIEEIKLND